MKETKKYVIREDKHNEIFLPRGLTTPYTADDILNHWYSQSCCESEEVASFDTLEEAKAEFEKYKEYAQTTYNKSNKIILYNVYTLNEEVYDEDNEFAVGDLIEAYAAPLNTIKVYWFETEDYNGVLCTDDFEFITFKTDDFITLEEAKATSYEAIEGSKSLSEVIYSIGCWFDVRDFCESDFDRLELVKEL